MVDYVDCMEPFVLGDIFTRLSVPCLSTIVRILYQLHTAALTVFTIDLFSNEFQPRDLQDPEASTHARQFKRSKGQDHNLTNQNDIVPTPQLRMEDPREGAGRFRRRRWTTTLNMMTTMRSICWSCSKFTARYRSGF
jgi:hypothetical protein